MSPSCFYAQELNNLAMRILVISEHYFPTIGGSTIHVHNLCKNLSKLSCEVYLVTLPDNEHPLLMWYNEENYKVYRLKIPRLLRKERYFPFFLNQKLGGILKEIQPDIVHFAHGLFAPLVTITNPELRKRPVVWTIHNLPPHEHAFEKFTALWPVHALLELVYHRLAEFYGTLSLKIVRYDRVICVSDKTAQLVLKKGVDKEKIKIISNGVDIDFFTDDSNASEIRKKGPVILTVAGITPHKGQEYLIESIPYILKKYPNALFILIGDIRISSYYKKITKLINEKNIQKNVKIILNVSQEDLRQYYSLADIYVQPSLEEGFCMSVLEAMASGKPVVGTKTGAIPEVLGESQGGIIIEPGSPKEISEAVLNLLSNKEKRKEMGIKARNYVADNFSWSKIAEKTMEVYKRF